MDHVLRFRRDGSFTIVQLTDLHWRNGDRTDQATRRVVECVLDAERPDLVLLTGDVISGGECRDPADAWRQAVAPITSRGIPWGAVFGNHDDEGSLSRGDLMTVAQELPHCVSRPGPERLTGVGNYVLTVRAAGSEQLAAALYCLDSGGYCTEEPGGYAWIADDQIAWFVSESARLSESHRALRGPHARPALPALAFFHIPLPEYNHAWERGPCRGEKREAVCCPQRNSGLFAALERSGDVLGSFVGHDHLNDYEAKLGGVRLCYGRATGHAGYGQNGFLRGARVIGLREGVRDFTTWLRLEDGSRVTQAATQ